MEIPRLGVELELQRPAYTTATATRDLSCICKLHHSPWQCWILEPLSEARDQTQVLMETSRICFCCTTGTPEHSMLFYFIYFFGLFPFLEPLPWHMEFPRLGV